MKTIINLALGLAFLLLLPVSLMGQAWPLLPDRYFLWGKSSNKEGNLWDQAWRVAVNPNGDKVFVAGELETTAGGSAFAVKAYDAKNGKLLWEKSYNREGAGWDGAFTVTADNNRVFVAGETVTAAGGVGFSIRAYNAKNGRLLWQNYYDREGALLDGAWKVALLNGIIFVAGESETTAGGTAITVRAYDAQDGSLLWEDYYDREGTGWDVGWSMAADGGSVFVAGETETAAGGSAFAVRAYDAQDGSLLWEDYYDREGTGWDAAYEIAANNGKVFAVGLSETASGGSAFAVRAYDATNGSLLWQDNYDREGAGWDVAWKVATDGTNVFVAGETETTAGGSAFTVRAYNATTGTLLWGNNYDREGALRDAAWSIAVQNNTVFAVGETETTAGGSAFAVRAYSTANGNLLYESNYDVEGNLSDAAGDVAVNGSRFFVVGGTNTTAGGSAFAVRAYNTM